MTSKDEALVLYKGKLVKSKNQIVENADFLMLFIGPIETFFFSVCLFFSSIVWYVMLLLY